MLRKFISFVLALNFALMLNSMLVLSPLLADDLANSNQIKPLVSFSPPPLITPMNALSHKVENQFDNSLRDYHSVTNTLDNAFNPFHFASGIYGNSTYNTLLAKFRASKVYGALNAHYTKANSYKDGDGNKVNFGYKRAGANAMLGLVLNSYNEFKTTFLFDDIIDDKQLHYVMDPVDTKRYIFKFDYRLGEEDLSNTLNLSALYRDFSRRANNYDLRPTAQAKTKMKVKRQIFDINARYDISWQSIHNEFGALYTQDRHLAKRFMMNGTTMPDFTHNGYRFANVLAHQISVFESIKFDFNEQNALNLGVHYDYNVANIKDKDVVVATQGQMQITANNMWFAHYGKRVDDNIKKDALSLALKYEFKPFSNHSYALNLQSIERIPTNDERFVAINPPNPNQAQAHAQAWVSNPFLKPERRNQIKFETQIKSEFFGEYMHSKYNENAFSVGGYIMSDFAKDFIIYDRFLSYTNANATQQANYRKHIITRNVDARVFSANANVAFNFWGNFGAKLNLWAAYGQNDTDKRPLYQIRPLEAQLNLDYEDYAFFGKFNVGSALRAVAKQTRRDDDINKGLGIDRDKAGFALLDIYVGISLYDKIGLRFGVDNVLDKTYSEYISISHVEAIAPTAIINAPGRTFYVSIHGNF